MSKWNNLINKYNPEDTDLCDLLDEAEKIGRADAEAELKPLLKTIRFALEDYSTRLGDYAKVIDEKLKENKNE